MQGTMQLLGGRPQNQQQQGGDPYNQGQQQAPRQQAPRPQQAQRRPAQQQPPQPSPQPAADFDSFDDDIPFMDPYRFTWMMQ